ncbi:MAG TPA: metallophosphoesterase [Tissierellia bacterium]|mgnify:FL=1|nr:metallophosphoesterase [Tissierellia bacterium]
MRLLYFTDTHIRGTTPKNRKDNLQETLERKLNEVGQIIKDYNIDYVLHGGDLFDRPDVSISIVSNFASILNSYNVPIYIISGNHDVYGHNPNTIGRTILGLLDALNVVRIIKENEVIYLNKGGVRVQLTGQPYTYNIDHEGYKGEYIVNEVSPDADFSIHMVHGMLLNKPFIKGVPYTLIDDILDTKADITLAGHYHSGFGIVETNNKYFVNPGSLIRITNSLREIERHPKVVFIELKDSINMKLIPLKTALKGEEVLDREEIENHIFKSERLFDFKQSIDAAINFDKLEINEILMEVSNAENVSDEVKKEALKRISNAQMRNIGDEI